MAILREWARARNIPEPWIHYSKPRPRLDHDGRPEVRSVPHLDLWGATAKRLRLEDQRADG